MVRMRPSLCIVLKLFPRVRANRDLDPQLRSFAGPAVQHQMAAKSLGAFPHSYQSIMPATRGPELLWVKAVTVVPHSQRDAIVRVSQLNIHGARVSMLDGIRQRLLDNTQQVSLDRGI